MVHHYFEAFERQRGAKPCDGSRIAHSVSRLLDRLDADEAIRRIGLLLADPYATGRTIHDLARDPDKWTVARPPTPSHAPTLQRGRAYEIRELGDPKPYTPQMAPPDYESFDP